MQKLIDYIKANPGMVIIVIVAGLMGWNMINVIRQNYEYQQKADKIADEISLMELENEKLKYNIEYYKTDSYLEQRARRSSKLCWNWILAKVKNWRGSILSARAGRRMMLRSCFPIIQMEL